MKTDVEGIDTRVLSHLLTSGVLCRVAAVYGEHLTLEWIAQVKALLNEAGCPTEITYMDDEGGDDSLPLPVVVRDVQNP